MISRGDHLPGAGRLRDASSPRARSVGEARSTTSTSRCAYAGASTGMAVALGTLGAEASGRWLVIPQAVGGGVPARVVMTVGYLNRIPLGAIAPGFGTT